MRISDWSSDVCSSDLLSQVGWRTTLLAGGYRTYRRGVSARLYDADLPFRIVLVDGDTGSGKTEILQELAARGAQVVDLEALACHRGSLFGGLAGPPQPSQQMFESRLLAVLDGLDRKDVVYGQSVSSRVERGGRRITTTKKNNDTY